MKTYSDLSIPSSRQVNKPPKYLMFSYTPFFYPEKIGFSYILDSQYFKIIYVISVKSDIKSNKIANKQNNKCWLPWSLPDDGGCDGYGAVVNQVGRYLARVGQHWAQYLHIHLLVEICQHNDGSFTCEIIDLCSNPNFGLYRHKILS